MDEKSKILAVEKLEGREIQSTEFYNGILCPDFVAGAEGFTQDVFFKSGDEIIDSQEDQKRLNTFLEKIKVTEGRLEDVLRRVTLEGAQIQGVNEIKGSFEVGKSPGVLLLTRISWKDLKLTDDSEVLRLV